MTPEKMTPELSPTDRMALYQSRELIRRTRVMRKAAKLLLATVFSSSEKRYLELVRDARRILGTEVQRIYSLDHPTKKRSKR